jgi:hypothetical protein
MSDGKWTLQGYDTFAHESYPLDGEFDTEQAAIAAAKDHLDELERTQPSASSGGQDGIQDRVYVVRPDGTSFRVRA